MEDLKNIQDFEILDTQYLEYWIVLEFITSGAIQLKTIKCLILKIAFEDAILDKNRVSEDETMKMKNALTKITKMCNINDFHVILEYNNKPFSKLVAFLTKREFSNIFSKIHFRRYIISHIHTKKI